MAEVINLKEWLDGEWEWEPVLRIHVGFDEEGERIYEIVPVALLNDWAWDEVEIDCSYQMLRAIVFEWLRFKGLLEERE